MIEVEIRGPLSHKEYESLKSTLATRGTHVESHEREMILLKELPGYSPDIGEREVDVRLRNTNGSCEIMIKRKVSRNNSGRAELSIPLPGATLEHARELAKAFGCTKGVQIFRNKETYSYEGIEWSLVTAPKDIRYFEAELGVEREREIPDARERLSNVARSLNLTVYTDKEQKEFVDMLNREVNKEIVL